MKKLLILIALLIGGVWVLLTATTQSLIEASTTTTKSVIIENADLYTTSQNAQTNPVPPQMAEKSKMERVAIDKLKDNAIAIPAEYPIPAKSEPLAESVITSENQLASLPETINPTDSPETVRAKYLASEKLDWVASREDRELQGMIREERRKGTPAAEENVKTLQQILEGIRADDIAKQRAARRETNSTQ